MILSLNLLCSIVLKILQNCIKLRKQKGQYFRNLTHTHNIVYAVCRVMQQGQRGQKGHKRKIAQKMQKPHCLFCFSHIQ